MSRSLGVWSLTTLSPILSVPLVISSSPATMRSAVVLPHPDGPTSTMNSPSRISTLRSFTAWKPLEYTLLTWSRVTVAIMSPWLRLLAHSGGQAAEQLAPGHCVQREEGQQRQHHCGEDRRHVDGVLALVVEQGERQHRISRALGEDEREQEAVPDDQRVVDAHGHQRGPGERNHERPQHLPLPGTVDAHGLEQFARHVAQEVDQDQHADRDRERGRWQDDRQQRVVQVQPGDHVVHGDDGGLQRDGEPEQEDVERCPCDAVLTAADDSVAGHDRDEENHEHCRRGDDDAVPQVRAELAGQDQVVAPEGQRPRQRELAGAEEPGLGAEAGDHDPVQRDDHDGEPYQAAERAEGVGAAYPGVHQAPSISLRILEKPENRTSPRDTSMPMMTSSVAIALAWPNWWSWKPVMYMSSGSSRVA